jgi:glucosyl-dolichyl phosphate glucuronosyltransferase
MSALQRLRRLRIPPGHEVLRLPLEMSVVIGTLNRSGMLEHSLESLLRQTAPPGTFEIVVVDNGSTDRTIRLVQDVMARAPHVRLVHEPTRGLSNARNRGIAEAAAPVVGFFDDDGIAEPDWAETILRVFREDPSVDAVGGRIHVRWPGARPEWMPRSLEGYYGHCDYGDTRRELAFPDYPFGPNMAIKREPLRRINGFRSELGPTGKNMMACGETDLFLRLFALPIKAVYEPAAVVHHVVEADRARQEWSLARAFRHGICSATMQYLNGDRARSTWVRRGVVASYRAAVGRVATTTARLGGRPSDVVMARRGYTAYWSGFAKGARGLLQS